MENLLSSSKKKQIYFLKVNDQILSHSSIGYNSKNNWFIKKGNIRNPILIFIKKFDFSVNIHNLETCYIFTVVTLQNLGHKIRSNTVYHYSKDL